MQIEKFYLWPKLGTRKKSLLLKLNICLSTWDFKSSNSDASMMVYDSSGIFVVFLIYMDDILVTKNNASFIKDVITKLNIISFLKDLGELNFS